MRKKNKIAIFASGTGSNAQQLIEHFNVHGKGNAYISLIISNKAAAGVLPLAARYDVDSRVVTREEFHASDYILKLLHTYSIDFVVLAGFLWLIPQYLVKAYPNRIVNIHPSLLPSFGGKGMYGLQVHRAVVAAGVRQTGMTIHYVNESYDEGAIILQAYCRVEETDSAEVISQKVLRLEHYYYPLVVEQLTQDLTQNT